MANVERYEMVQQVKDLEGNIVEEKTTQKTKKIAKLSEPDYIKLYTQMWQGKSKDENKSNKVETESNDKKKPTNKIPANYRLLFVELATRMSYCDADDLEHSQLVNTGGIYQDDIMWALGWESRDSLQKGLKALCDCRAIRRVCKGLYQVNPLYAAKGQWKYNPRVSQSSLEELLKYFEEEIRKAERKKAEKIKKELTGKLRSGKPVTEKTEPEKLGTAEPRTAEPLTAEPAVEKAEKPKAEVSAEKKTLDLENWRR